MKQQQPRKSERYIPTGNDEEPQSPICDAPNDGPGNPFDDNCRDPRLDRDPIPERSEPAHNRDFPPSDGTMDGETPDATPGATAHGGRTDSSDGIRDPIEPDGHDRPANPERHFKKG